MIAGSGASKHMVTRVGILCLLAATLLPIAASAQRGSAQAATTTPPAVWLQTELTDVNSGETFTLADFAGTPILLESFAVWCPVCLSQQLQIEGLHSTPISFVSVSVDTDPHESAAEVVCHTPHHGFADYDHWHYAVAPVALTRALVSAFGPVVASVPSAPVILICADQSARLLRSGVKRVAELEQELQRGCAA